MKSNRSLSRHSASKSARQSPHKTPTCHHKPVIQRYRHQHQVNANTLRLRAIVRLFRLTPTDIAKATNFSRPYISRLLNEADFRGSAEFYRTLEQKLGVIIDGRSAQYFTVSAVAVRSVEKVMAMADTVQLS